jgi:hypothetical protein
MNKGIKYDFHSTIVCGFMNKGVIWTVDKSYVDDLLVLKMNICRLPGLPLLRRGTDGEV